MKRNVLTCVLAAASVAAILALEPALAREALPACDGVAADEPGCTFAVYTMWVGPDGVIHSESTEPVPVDCDDLPTYETVVVSGGSSSAK